MAERGQKFKNKKYKLNTEFLIVENWGKKLLSVLHHVTLSRKVQQRAFANLKYAFESGDAQ